MRVAMPPYFLIFRRYFLLTLCVMLSLLSACTGGSGDDDDDDDNGGGGGSPTEETQFDLSGTTNDRGIASVGFNVASGTTKFSVTAFTPNGRFVQFEEILSDSGENYLNPDRESISFADSYGAFANSATIPSRSTDPALDGESRFIVSASVAASEGGSALAGEDITFTVLSKNDGNLNSGRLIVNIFYVGDVGQDSETKEIMSLALEEFRRIYSSAAGISLQINELDISGPVSLPLPVDGDRFYRNASEGAASPAVNVFIGGDIEEVSASGDVLGIAASVPGPPIPSERSGVAISFFAGAGSDGFYDQEDVRILGETLAHESGHFMGLFHPVDFGGSTVQATDPLTDTPDCSFITECVSNDDLIDNLMFASPISDGSGGFVSQNQLSDQQRGVLNRYIAVD